MLSQQHCWEGQGTGAQGCVLGGAGGGEVGGGIICIHISKIRSFDPKTSLPENYPKEIIRESSRMFITALVLIEKKGREGVEEGRNERN